MPDTDDSIDVWEIFKNHKKIFKNHKEALALGFLDAIASSIENVGKGLLKSSLTIQHFSFSPSTYV